MRGKRISPELIPKFQELYTTTSLSINAIAKQFGVCNKTVKSYTSELGFKKPQKAVRAKSSFRPKGPKPKRRPDMTPEQQALFDEHYTMVRSILMKNGGKWRAKLSGTEIEDLESAGLVGLWRAALKFDPSRGLSFKTLAYRTIMGDIYEAIEIARYGARRHGRDLIDHSKFQKYDEVFDEDE